MLVQTEAFQHWGLKWAESSTFWVTQGEPKEEKNLYMHDFQWWLNLMLLETSQETKGKFTRNTGTLPPLVTYLWTVFLSLGVLYFAISTSQSKVTWSHHTGIGEWKNLYFPVLNACSRDQIEGSLKMWFSLCTMAASGASNLPPATKPFVSHPPSSEWHLHRRRSHLCQERARRSPGLQEDQGWIRVFTLFWYCCVCPSQTQSLKQGS